MNIDHDKRGHPRAMLVSVSLPEKQGEDGGFFTVFIPIAEILKLRHVDRFLVGHPWLDVPNEEIIGMNINKTQYNFIERHLSKGHYIAIRGVGLRGKKSRGCYLDTEGQAIVEYRFGWRRRDRYIKDEIDLRWLESFQQQSEDYANQVVLIEAIAGYFKRLSDKVAKAPKPKRKRVKPKIKAKYRKKAMDK
jgi:hypothetical protein